MASYEPYERDTRRYVREERREERGDPRFLDSHYSRTTSRDLIPRGREDSELSVEEIRREFPPPTGRDIRRARSAEPYYDDDYDDYYDRRSRRGAGSTSGSLAPAPLERRKSKHRSMSKQEKIIAAVAGAALLAGGKELYDRREAKQEGGDIHRNALHSVALAGVGALAAYQGAEFYNKQQAKKDQKAKLLLDGRYASDDEDDPREKKGNKSFIENALAATGLGAAVKSLTGGKDKDDDSKSRGGSPSRAGPAGGAANKVQKAAMASLLAGATEAFRVAKEPGGWKGEKTKRILTAAAGAASVDAAQGSDHGKLGMAESVIGGLVGTRLIRGSKNDIEEDKKTGRSRSRSRARSEGGGGTGLAALATAGLGALGAKKAYDHHRSKSRGRSDSRGSGSRSPSRRRSRSRSVVDKARDGLAKLGIGGGALALTNKDDDDRRRTQDDFDDRDRSRSRDRGSRRSRRYSDDYDDDYRPRRSDRDRDYYDEDDRRSTRGSRRDRSHGRGGRSEYAADSDLGDSSEDEKRAKKMRDRRY
jgi:hypothetical protein